MQRVLSVFLLVLLVSAPVYAGTGLLFNVAATGVPANVTATVCLDGRVPVSCQRFTLSALGLQIRTTVPGHTYTSAGIKIDEPGYTLTGCTEIANGYCIFTVSDTSPASVQITSNTATQYWVATTGNDANSGDEQNPFLTIEHARDVVRAHPQRGVVPIYVNIHGGTYRFTQTLSLIQSDSGAEGAPVVYRAVPGETPVISGGQQLTGWTLHDIPNNIWRAQGNVGAATIMPRQLYVNGARATRARSTDYPNYYTPSANGYTFAYSSGAAPVRPNWTNVPAIEVVTVTQWKMMRCPLDHIDKTDNDNSELYVATPCWTNANYYPSPWNFHLLSWFENAYEFMDTPGYWYMDPGTQVVYYIPKAGENMASASVELPVLEKLIDGVGNSTTPISHIIFDGLTFRYATWLNPGSTDGYVCDQSGFHITGNGHGPNTIGHDPDVVRTPGNISFIYAQNIIFTNNTFEHFGGVALDFDTGSQNNKIVYNDFNDISSAGIQVGGVSVTDHHPSLASQETKDNEISNNLLQYTGQDYYDAAAIYIGFTTRSLVEHNEIRYVPWSGIAIGWGWGLLDPGGFPGLPNASYFDWGVYLTPTPALSNQIKHNKIEYYLQQLWDGGAIYSTGFTGTSLADGQYIAYNVAQHKRANSGSNTFYTDGGSRYIRLTGNVSLNNPQGYLDFGPCGLSSSFTTLCADTNVIPYGADTGGCIPYGDIKFTDNYLRDIVTFYDICFNINTIGFPVNVTASGSTAVTSASQVPAWIINSAGRQ